MGDRERNYSTCQNLATSIQAELNTLPEFSKKRCIYKVPKSLRKTNTEAYTPLVVSIGPLHYKDDNLLPMEAHKLKYLEAFLNDSQNNTNLNYCLQVIKDKETQIRESYANPTLHISSDEFTRMVLVDSVFIIEIFRRFFYPSLVKDDQIFGNPCMITEVMRDIKLAENQLPFFILKDLYWIAFKPHHNNGTSYFTDLACFSLEVNKRKICIEATANETTCCHLLDLLRMQYLPSELIIEVDIDETNAMKNTICPTALSLFETGVKFRVDKSDTTSWNDVYFDNNKGVLTIPRLRVGDETEAILRNLIAFEQCQYQPTCETYISDYQFFLDCLINTPEDVHVLAKAGIIENLMGSDKDVSGLVNSLGHHVILVPGQYYYGGITEKLNRYCDKRWNRYKATLRHTYFKHPWTVISLFYAAILLLLTLTQVVLAIMSLPFVIKKS